MGSNKTKACGCSFDACVKLFDFLQVSMQTCILDFLCMSPIQRIYYRERCVSRIIFTQKAHYLLPSQQTVLFMADMSSTTTREYQELSTLTIILGLLKLHCVR